ncbi:LysR family transcriptional regulator substrate-binding protein [Tessaracoccus palaemonis]|uniref:LysR family transcriptional regulator substrate-binding protein n=1 Tax=Tessaracoccus palaemonis TaxID=2829499 RepID=A0ABX8SII4_9ACTN|nr:LysR family transcriptional regulator substrate-binding protein [Tessaracoccus palaemonis]QXT63192.1 LysR family transcriptional regulator substrate-binding protein [Tessaracoccus palaemonis]
MTDFREGAGRGDKAVPEGGSGSAGDEGGARPVVDDWALGGSARPAGSGLRVGYVPGVILTKWRRTWAERFPDVPLEAVGVEESEVRRALSDGVVDLCFVRLPVEPDGLHLIQLYEEQPVVWVAKEHAIAAVDEVSVADLADEEVLTDVSAVNIDRVVAEVAVLRVPLSVARSNNRRDLVHRPVVDAPTTTVALAWPRDVDSDLIQEFIGVVRGRSVNSSRSARERADRDGGAAGDGARKRDGEGAQRDGSRKRDARGAGKQPASRKPRKPAPRGGRGRRR